MSHDHSHGNTEDPFDRRVAMTMAIVAAFLACTTMFSHRAHNETLILQGEANRLQTESNIFHTQASDQWAFFQAKNIRAYQTQGFLGITDALKDPKHDAPAIANDWRAQIKKYEGELPQLKAEAEALVVKANAAAEASKQKLEDSHHAHHRAARFDYAELAIELALVLCSVAVLSKRNLFWYGGILAGVVGVGLTGVALLTH
ncbi:MAG: DUF4337 domain-containing protein [Deltaproteobacteria bacterium]|nr:DUF4337 domain-containing protein [Deltaproteobacteria bacterium]